MKIKLLVILAAIINCAPNVSALTRSDSLANLNYVEINNIYNPQNNITSPTKVAFNRVENCGEANIGYTITDGDFKDIYSGERLNTLSVKMEGYKTVDKFNFMGGISYNNTLEKSQHWSSTLYLSESNPFILGPEEVGNRRLEEFVIFGTGSYKYKKLTAGAAINYKTGSQFGQYDPRAETTAMRFSVAPGISYDVSKKFRVGASFEAEFYNEQISYSVVNNLEYYIYYLHKGSGNYEIKSSGDDTSYPREYTGNRYKGAIQLLGGTEDGNITNSTEIAYIKNTEISQDGDGTLVYLSGDFYQTIYSLSNRTTIGANKNIVSNIELNFSMEENEGYWCDQKKMVDTDHGNITYYETLLRYKLNEATIIKGEVAYQLSIMKRGAPDYIFGVEASYYKNSTKQNDGGIKYSEDFDNYTIGINGRKFWSFKHFLLDIAVNGAIKMNLTDPLYEGVDTDITETFTNPYFAYVSSESYQYGATINMSVPIKIKRRYCAAGLMLKGMQTHQLSESNYYTFAQKRQNYFETKLFIKF